LIRQAQLRVGHVLQRLEADTRRHLPNGKAVGGNVEHGKIGVDALDDAGSGGKASETG
jgi:hypothetical protein